MDRQQPELPPIELPPMRTFIVRRMGMVKVEEVTVQAHSWEPIEGKGALFSTYYLKNGEPYKNARRAFYDVLDIEETTPIPVELPKVETSRIIH